MSRSDPVAEGHVFRAPYPFVRVTYHEADEDGVSEVPSWAPGTRFEGMGPECGGSVADGMGEIFLTVVSVHKPGRYPTRVFFTRQWRRPDGNVFGRSALQIATLEKFRRLARGYAHEFVLRPEGEQRCA